MGNGWREQIEQVARTYDIDPATIGWFPSEPANAATMHEARTAEMTPKIHAAASRAADRMTEILERQGLPLTVTYEIT